MEMLNRILYKYSNMDNSSQVLIFLIVLVFLMLISIVVINVITKKRKNKDKLINDNKVVKLSSELDLPFSDNKDENIETLKLNTKEEETIEEIKDEDVVEIKVSKTSLDEITNLIENTLEQKPIDLTKFEEDQEENAIISYDELVKRAGAKKIIYKCDDTPKEKVQNEEPAQKVKFKASRVISPIYGVQKKEEEKDEVLDSFVELEKVQNENKEDIESLQDMEFLGSLKKFRNEL